MNADGSNVTRLTHTNSADSPAWSPDGTRLLFSDDGFHVMNADGSNITRLTTSEDPSGDPCCFNYATWSADGSRIMFTDTHWSTAYFSDVYVMNADGSGITRLTNAEQIARDTNRLWIPRNLAWSPHGSRIVADVETSNPNALFATIDLFVMDPDGSRLTNLSNNSTGTSHKNPSWSSDQTRIVFECNPNQTWQICTMNADGSGIAVLTDGAEPHWWGPAAPASVPTSPPSANARCFEATGYCIDGRIREYWEQNGGLTVFGLPIGPQQPMNIEGKTVQAQWFERNRLELHPENAPPYDVLLGRLGAARLAQQDYDWQTVPRDAPQEGCRFFEETGRNVCGDILTAWRASGLELDGQRGFNENENLALFGLPLTGMLKLTYPDGREFQVQYFERARFELHPENAPPFHVQLGLLGSEVRGAR